MKLSTRDEFRSEVKLVLSQRAGLICSNPACAVHTSGPRSEALKSVSIGVAAHITAASEGGPRFDPSLSMDDRASVTNGIWLCQNCAKLIDNDPNQFSVILLKEWKNKSEGNARSRLGKTLKSKPTEKSRLREIKRQQKLRDDIHKCLLRKPEARRAIIESGDRSRLAKFARSEVIIRNIDDESYPNQAPTMRELAAGFV